MDFWLVVFAAYLKEFPGDDTTEAKYTGKKTASGKMSKKKLPGEQIGICEVRRLVCPVESVAD